MQRPEEIRPQLVLKRVDIVDLVQLSRALCSICQSNFHQNEEIARLHCARVFHVSCIDNWFLEVS